ncbi:MAG: sugar ABC transporter ATP-binding protein [Clostridia bacterium]|jgi:ribose transport system ATP-binding protein|nr:sugar ABC transporter ATP-binding protein [Clostridia bacterium]
MSKYQLKVKDITKVFDKTVVALDNVTCSFESGSVHAIIGKNGSGKSTLIKIIAGVHDADEGEICLYDKKIEHNSPIHALKNGIATVYQELSLVGDLKVGENIFLGRLPMKSKVRINWAKMEKDSREVLAKLGVDLDPNMYVKKLSVGQQQLVEIAKAMSFDPKVLILDEPTSALSNNECEHLFEAVRNLKKHGIIILFITHRLQELFKIADSVTVLRDGKYIGTESMSDMRPEDIVNMMFGDIEKSEKPPSSIQDDIVLQVKNLKTDKIDNVSFELKKGEILGIAGMMGSGRTEVLRAIFGLDKLDSGEIIVRDKVVKSPSPEIMKKLGLGFTSENRKEEALCLNLSIADNLCLASIYDISSGARIDRKKEKNYVERQIDALSIKVNDPGARTDSMSGGNQQKIVVGNWLNTSPQILLMDEPSRGIDVNAKQQIFNIIWEAAKNGVSTIMVSSELEEVLGVCDRVLVMRQGEIHAEMQACELSVESIYAQCMKEDEVKCLNI